MAQEFHLPDIGEGLTEATIISWYVAVGEEVGLDEPLVEVETDKAVVDIPSPHAGTLLYQGGEAGDTIEVEALLAVVGAAGESWTPAEAPPGVAPIVGTLDEASTAVAEPTTGIAALPKVRKLAAELGVDLTNVAGTGVGGRITEDDVRSAAATAETGPVERVPMSATRRAIADNLARSWREIPHVTTYGEVDAGPLLAKRAALGKPALDALLVAAVVPLLHEHPAFNAAVAGSDIVYKKHYDIGIAVDTPHGLTVAVIKRADTKSIEELDAEVRRLSAAAKQRELAVDELRGQTFTLSNIGAVGGRFGTPLIPLGTAAILSVGRADERPVVRDGEVVIGREFPLSLSYDHRIVDGAAGRAFMAAVIDALSAE